MPCRPQHASSPIPTCRQQPLRALAQHKGTHPLAISAVSGPKANRARDILKHIDLLFCNEAEAAILADEYADLAALPEILMEAGVASGIITKGNAGLSAWKDGQQWSPACAACESQIHQRSGATP